MKINSISLAFNKNYSLPEKQAFSSRKQDNDKFELRSNELPVIEKRKFRCKRIPFSTAQMPLVSDILHKVYSRCYSTENLTEKANINNCMTVKMETAYFDDRDNLLALVTRIKSPEIGTSTIIHTSKADYFDMDGDGYIESKNVDNVFYEVRYQNRVQIFKNQKAAKAFVENLSSK